MIHELSYGIQRLADGRRKERFRSYLQNLLSSGLPVLAYDSAAALWHGEQRARLEARGLRPAFADGQIAAIAATQGLVLVTRNISDYVAFDGLQLLNLVSPWPQSPLRQLGSLRWILFRRSASGLRLERNAWNSTASQKPRATDPRCSASTASIREPWLACRHFLILTSP